MTLLAAILFAAGCASGGGGDEVCGRCTSFGFEPCNADGSFGDPIECADGEVCIPGLGCGVCQPGTSYCDGNDVYSCNDAGDGGDFVESCEGDLVCSQGACVTPCERADDEPSNVGCHFWAADLDNEAFSSSIGGGFGSNDAAAQQYAVAVANDRDNPVTVWVYENQARVGDAIDEAVVDMRMVAPHSIEQIDLPQREVDGTMGQNGVYDMDSSAGTFVSPHAFRIESSDPVVAYQFNPIIQQFSNDASILIPRQALGADYFILGWPTSNPCGPPEGDMLHQQSIPDHTSITIIGTEDDTHIRVVPTHPILASSGDSGIAVPATAAGETLELTINQYDVVNLESDQPEVGILDCLNYTDRDGDFTGTQVHSDKRIAVFSSNERGSGTGGADVPDPPNWTADNHDECCTDHLEQQMFPTTALGWQFAISRSPVRSTMAGYAEPDLYRVMATENNTQVFTSLPAPRDRFTLNAGEQKTFWADTGFAISSEGGAIMVGQYLVSQGRVPGGIGDPTFIVFPAAEQHRKSYVYLVPTTFEDNFAVFAHPEGAALTLDGAAPSGCESAPIGTVNGTAYVQTTCPMSEGVHRVSADVPFGLTVYGYYNVGSYGYPGGSDVELINPVD